MKIQIEEIELLIERMDEIGRKGPLMSSISWMFAMSIGRAVVQLRRVHDPEDERYSNWTDEQKAAEIRLIEGRIYGFQELLGWASSQGSRDYLPSGADVAARLSEPMERPQGSVSIADLASEFDITEEEATAMRRRNAERFSKEADLSAMAAKLAVAEIEREVDSAIGEGTVISEVDVQTCLRLVERIAEKAAGYAQTVLDLADRTNRTRRRATLNAEHRLLRKLEEDADKLLDRYTALRDSTTDDSPIEAQVKELVEG